MCKIACAEKAFGGHLISVQLYFQCRLSSLNLLCIVLTVANIFQGCEMESVKLEGSGKKKKIIRVKEDSAVEEIMRIGHTNKSATFVPDVVDGVITFCDCPGFLDNRGAEINISNAVNIKMALHAAASVRCVVVVNYFSLKADRGRGLNELTRILSDLFGEGGRLLQNADSILLGVSQVPVSMDDEEVAVRS